jgi:outer membrane protein TolC
MLSGDNRADLFSVGVSFDLPLFTKNRQDKQLIASVAKAEAVQTDKLLATKRMLSNLEKELMQLRSLTKRKNLYTDHLLAQSNEQAEATLTAYTNDDGFFSDVVRARISELNTKILALEIDINRLKTISRINYFLPASEHIVSNATGHY